MKAIRLHSIYIGMAALLGLSSCAKQYYQLRPVSGEVAELEGRSVTKAAADSLEVVASFERIDMEYLALDIELKNHTTRTLDVDPSNFRMTLLDANKQPLAQPDRTRPGVVDFKQAADPDYEAGRMEQKVKREEARLKRNKIINTVLMVALVAADVASSTAPKRNGREWNNFIATQNTVGAGYNILQMKRVIDHSSFANNMQRFQFEEYRWRQLAMKRTELKPGETVRGFVYLPKASGATYLNLTYPTATGNLEILFEQNLTKGRQ